MGINPNARATSSHYILITIIISLISCLFMPFVLVFLFQDLFFYSKEYWFFTAPSSAYFTFALGMIWISVVLSLYLMIKSVRENKGQKTKNWIFIMALSICFLFFYQGINNYYYFSDDGLYYSDLFSFKGEHYFWNDYHQVKHVIYQSSAGFQSQRETIFITQNGKEISIPYNHDYKMYNSKIMEKLREQNIEIERVHVLE